MERTADELRVFCDASNGEEIYHVQRGRRRERKRRISIVPVSAVVKRKGKESLLIDRNESLSEEKSRKRMDSPKERCISPGLSSLIECEEKEMGGRLEIWHDDLSPAVDIFWSAREKTSEDHIVPMSSWYVYLSLLTFVSLQLGMKISLTSYTFSRSFSFFSFLFIVVNTSLLRVDDIH